ncbi:hypothetical protein [Pseudoalteromonas rhizosphaerae]|uniref:Alpha/beta hydrolase n=1 Tax=Pseudoalteromonas rhizosphaerae TaxID=2518973 RepID=A0ABW8KXZ4_9GAMM
MTKPVLIIMHGVGEHTEASFKEEVINGANNALHRYSSHAEDTFESHFEGIESIGYDALFEQLRTQIEESGNSIEEYIKMNLGGVDVPSLLDAITGIDTWLGGDKFEHTHVLDVVFYLSIFGEKVRTHVAEKLADIYLKYPQGTSYHFVTHSLATAVMHDTLTKIYPSEYSIGTHNISSYWTFANVSDLVTWASDLTSPYNSVVKPGPGGILEEFFNVYHEFDPITFDVFKRFDPVNNGTWVNPEFFDSGCRKITTKDFSRLNTHSIEGYIEDPLVSYPFLYKLLDDFNPSLSEQNEANDKFQHFEGEVQKIKDFKFTGDFTGDIKGLIEMIKAFKQLLEENE